MLLVTIVLGCLCLAMIVLTLRARRPAPADRLDAAFRDNAFVLPGSGLDEDLRTSALKRWILRRIAQLQGALEQVTTPRAYEQALLTMERLGRGSRRAAFTYLIARAGLIILAAAGAAWALFFFDQEPVDRLLLAVFIALLLVGVPMMILQGRIRARQEDIRCSLPDVIDLLAVSAEAGMGMDGAVAVVIRRKPGPLSQEFDRMLLEMQLGSAREEAWDRMVERVNLPELRSFASALQDADEMGVSIADTLRAQSDALRVKRTLLVRQFAATLPIKMLFPLIFCILPSLFAVLLGPGLIAIFAAFDNLNQ